MGITKKNIRFYEEQGLLSPRRNSENGYRDYGEGEVERLRQIKLMRKLGVPLEEIRKMQDGTHTLGDGMRRHLVTLEREKENLEQAMQLCRVLKERQERLDALNAEELLEQMECMERDGTTFMNKQQRDVKAGRYVAPVVITLGMTALMVGIIVLLVWLYLTDPSAAPPLPLLAVLACLAGLVILGACLALRQRVEEIRKGEIDDAKHY